MSLSEQKEKLKQYILAKLAIDDFHAIRDCAVDLEILQYKMDIERLQSSLGKMLISEKPIPKCTVIGKIDLKKN